MPPFLPAFATTIAWAKPRALPIAVPSPKRYYPFCRGLMIALPTWYLEPHWILAIIFLVVGFYVLIKGADVLVEAAVSLAQRSGLSTAVIGATVVAFGTSLPELVVCLTSMVQAQRLDNPGAADIAMANVVGSNISNIALILGIAALWRVLPVPASCRRLDYPVMVVATLLMIVVSLPLFGGPAVVSRGQGLILGAGLLIFVGASVALGRRSPVIPEDIPATQRHHPGTAIGLVIVGMILMTVGGDVALTGAISIADTIGMSERVIGLTVVAIGTSLPELATSIQAARRGHTAIAIGNVIGSNIFNCLFIVGTASMIMPIPIAPQNWMWDYWWMLGFTLIIAPMMLWSGRIQRWHGVLLLILLTAYLASLFVVT